MAADYDEIAGAIRAIEVFAADGLTDRIATLEAAIRGRDLKGCTALSVEAQVTPDLLRAAYAIKRAAGQINVLIHAVGITLLVPQILEAGERVEYVSLGAGSTGRLFDLETDRRVAEFKFVHWQGGPETIRQNALFKDFYLLAESDAKKRKELYVLGTTHPTKFLKSGRALKNILNRNGTLARDFKDRYGERFETVNDYYEFRRNAVKMCDAAPLLPELVRIAAADVAAEQKAADA